jgi:hypothetical protein
MNLNEFLTNSTCIEQNNSITAEKILQNIQEAIDVICPILYYHVSRFVEKGQVIYIKANDYCPEYIVVNKDDFVYIKDNLKNRQLKNISEAPLSSYTVHSLTEQNFTDIRFST